MKRPTVLTPDAAGRELAKVLRVIGREREQLADIVKERRGHIAALEKRARELVDIANGAAVQVELDTDEGEREEEPAAAPAVVASIVAPPKRDRGRKKADPDKLAQLLDAAPPWLRDQYDHPDGPRLSEHWWPDLHGGEPAHAPDGSRCPVSRKDWRECATCMVQVSSGRRPLPAPELPLKGGAA